MRVTIEVDRQDIRRALRFLAVVAFVGGVALPALVGAGQVTGLLTFSPGQTIRAGEINANFAAVKTAVDDNHTRIGDLTTLQTGARSSLVAAVNELRSSGVQGPQGPAGADGSLRVYGNGSAGARVISADTTLADTNFQYTDFTVNAGVTLTVDSGLELRCTGTFTCNGTIVVRPVPGSGGRRFGNVNGAIDLRASLADPGIGLRAAEPGDYGSDTVDRTGGSGGVGANALGASLRLLVRPGRRGGGGGGAAFSPSAGSGGLGGGSLLVLARQGISISSGGLVDAAAPNGSLGATGGGGGGGGGVVVLASAATIAHAGQIDVRGGSGDFSFVSNGAGGGGAGGLVHFLAPTVTNTGGVNDAGGAAGGNSFMTSSSVVSGGGGGGGSRGDGGAGGSVDTANNAGPATAGSAGGGALVTLVDPTSLF